jgi:hypothetical protein
VSGPLLRRPRLAKNHYFVAQHAGRSIGGGEFAGLLHHVHRVVADAANVAALRSVDRIPERELGIAAIDHVTAVGLDGLFQHGPLVVGSLRLGGGRIETGRHAPQHFEMRVESVGRLRVAAGLGQPSQLRHAGHRVDHRAIHGRQLLAHRVERTGAGRGQLMRKFCGNCLERFGIEDRY